MKASASSDQSIPCIAQTDVLVLGSGAAAVVAALQARKQGAKVYLASDRSYVGEELTAWLDPLPSRSEQGEVLASLLENIGESPAPLAIKRALEQALMAAGIPFLFNARPIGLLEDGTGTVAGAVLAARCAWFAIQARHVIDATLHAQAVRLGPWPFHPRNVEAGFARLLRSEGEGRKVSIPRNQEIEHYTVHSSSFPVASGTMTVAELASLEQQARESYFDPAQSKTCDSLRMPAPWQFDPIEEKSGLSLVGTAALKHSAFDFGALFRLAETAGTRAAERAAARTAGSGIRWMNSAKAADASLHPGPTPTRWLGCPSLALSAPAFPVLDEVDVLVVGGGTGGAGAAIGAARSGARTLLIESLPGLGGVGTLGLIGKYWFGNKVGFTAELDEGVAAMGSEGAGGKFTGGWNPEWKMAWYLRETGKAGGRVWFGSSASGVSVENGRVAGVLVSTPFGCGLVRARAVVDATGNADIPSAAGAPCRTIGASHVAVQGTGLTGRQPGAGYSNTDHSFIDENDPVDITRGFVHAREKFSSAYDLAQIVDSRERRQIIGELELSPLDFLADRTFPDTVVIARSNFDTHGFTVHPVFMTYPPDKKPLNARVPFRCLLPQGLEGVLVTGLGVSAHRDAIPVIRMQADVQNQGYAAGIAAALAAQKKCGLRELSIRELQRRWVECGILPASVLEETDSFPLGEEAIHAAIASGMQDHSSAAVILGHPQASIPLLRKALASPDTSVAANAAVLLGMMGQAEAAPLLMRLVQEASWDQGWNYTGMGQFGMSLSRVDAMILALGRTGDRQAIPVLLEKIKELGAGSDFSHCRAVALAACCLRSPELAEPLAHLLSLPGMSGHAREDLESALRETDPNPEETASRNQSLRELMLARGLHACGDFQGTARRILEQYSRDLRGHYLSHATALLRQKPDTAAPAPLAERLEMA